MKHFSFLWLGLLLLGMAAGAQAQALDPGFAAATIYAPGPVYSVIEQADGKRVAAGAFTRVNGTAAPSIACFNPDGSLNEAFRLNVGTATGVLRLRKANNGQLLFTSSAANGLVTAGGISRREPLRLNADGTADASFNPGVGATYTGQPTYVNEVVALPNGQTIVVGPFDQFNGVAAPGIARLTTTGTVDGSFNAGSGLAAADGEIETIVAQPDGKLFIGGLFSSYNGIACQGLARLNADGSFDTGFSQVLGKDSEVRNIVVQPNGRILIAGVLRGAPGSLALARLLPTGAYDSGFRPPSELRSFSVTSFTGEAMQVQPDGKVMFINSLDLATLPRVSRLNVDGSLDNSFTVGTGPNSTPRSVVLLASGKILVTGDFTAFSGTYNRSLMQLTSTGAVDPAFLPLVQFPGTVAAMARQADGRLVVGGTLSEINGQPVQHLARFNPDGTLDAAFSANPTLETRVVDLALSPGGRVLAAGAKYLLRFLPTGLPDNTLRPVNLGDLQPARVLLQPDGRVLVGGGFVSNNSLYGGQLTRLLPDGSPDPAFTPAATGVGSLQWFDTMALQPDGKVLVAGAYYNASNSITSSLIRLGTDGNLDGSFMGRKFTVNSSTFNFRGLAVQPDGKIVVSGRFTAYDGTARNGIARLNADGLLDAGFVPPAFTGTVSKLLLQPNNRILLGGQFTGTTLPTNLARLLPNGQADASFGNTAAPNGGVNELLLQPDGTLYVGGSFSGIGGQPRLALARLTAPNVLRVAATAAVAESTAAWPVPARTTLSVAPAATAHPLALDLLDALGRPVRHLALTSAATVTLPLETLAVGTYLLRVTYAEGLVMRRIQVR